MLEKSEDKESVVVVRAHGISPQRREYLKGLGLPFRDGTCPDVGIIAGKVKLHAEKGLQNRYFWRPQASRGYWLGRLRKWESLCCK